MATVIIAKVKQKNDADFKIVDQDDIDGAAHVLLFAFPDENLSAAVFGPRPSFILLDKFSRPNVTGDQRFTVTADTAGTGTNTIVIETATGNPFTTSPTWTVRATLQLGTTKRVSTSSFNAGWLWNPATEYLRVRCSALGTAPKEVVAYLEWDYDSNP